MRNITAITTALLIGGTAATIALQSPSNAQTAQNEPGAIQIPAPRPGAPMSFADMVAKLQPAVVNISTRQRVPVGNANPFAGTPFGDLFGGGAPNRPITREATSLGSGFIISSDGYIVTNNHVIANPQAGSNPVGQITVTLSDRKEYPATLVGRDASSDLAVLKISAPGALPFVKFGDSSRTRVGDWVIAIGQPYGLGGTVTAGIVSALHRNIGQGGAYDRYIQTDASINQGNSGGPMFDLQGNVIGINNAIFSPTGGSVGIGFAIPAEQAAPVVQSLRSGKRPQRGYLGVQIQPLDEGAADALGLEKNRGELVGRVEPGQAAARAGIQQGDVIVRVNNRDVSPDDTLSFIVANLPVGSRVPIELIRNGRRMSVTATLAERPTDEVLARSLGGDDETQGMIPENAQSTQQATRDALGLAVQPLTPQIARQVGVPAETRGVVVGAVDPSSDAGQKGLQRGDVILSINQRPVATVADVTGVVAAAKTAGRNNVLLYVQRGANPAIYRAVRLNEK
ncbi:MAG: Do family serine endopeptidase [Sphingomonadaceae bacterium]